MRLLSVSDLLQAMVVQISILDSSEFDGTTWWPGRTGAIFCDTLTDRLSADRTARQGPHSLTAGRHEDNVSY